MSAFTKSGRSSQQNISNMTVCLRPEAAAQLELEMHLSETVKHAFVNFDLMPTLFEKIVDLPHLLMRFFVLVAGSTG